MKTITAASLFLTSAITISLFTLNANAQETSNRPQEKRTLEEPSLAKQILKNFESRTILNCRSNESLLLIEFTGSTDSWKNDGFVRVTLPGSAGGAKVIYLEPYIRATHLDPQSNEVTMRIVSSKDSQNETNSSSVIFDLRLVPKKSKLVFSVVEGSLSLSGKSYFLSNSRNEITCSWGKGKTNWD